MAMALLALSGSGSESGSVETCPAPRAIRTRKRLYGLGPGPGLGLGVALSLLLAFPVSAASVRLKELVDIQGVRDNDLKGNHSSDLTNLAMVHGDPHAQREHCLRADDQKEPGGTQAALMDCRAFILERAREAVDALDASGKPDPAKRTTLPVFLQVRHRIDASLPTYYVRIGQAIHAVTGLAVTTRMAASTIEVVENAINKVAKKIFLNC